MAPPDQQSNKRKAPPPTTQNNNKPTPNKKQKTSNHSKRVDFRTLSTQTTSAAFTYGALDVSTFVGARQYEIRALEQGMQRAKKAQNRRAFQQVPRDFRRRTAAHDAKRVPKRLRARAGREMVEDNTPGKGGVGEAKKKVGTKARLRLETVKKLRALGAKKKAEQENREAGKVKITDVGDVAMSGVVDESTTQVKAVQPRKARVKKAASLAQPPAPKAKFRKRQKNKSWLPTHLFHAKRAHMTPPSAAMWRFAMPLTPTQKSYRSIHRASRNRGAVAWDVSYMSTIGLSGEQRSLVGMLKALGVGVPGRGGEESAVWGAKGEKSRRGTRSLESFVFEREAPHKLIAPVTIIWCGVSGTTGTEVADEGKTKRMLYIRVHPSAFFQLWEEVVRLSKVAKPAVTVADLRFEIGSIEITGPGANEALQGALWPYPSSTAPEQLATEKDGIDVGDIWTQLAGLTASSSFPAGALLAFEILDPRLHHPPRPVSGPKTQDEQNKLLELLTSWPIDIATQPAALFDRAARTRATKFPSQKSINRRKTLADPGSFPIPLTTDPAIPIILLAHPTCGGFTLLAPWKAIQPIWYSIIYCPLTTGGQPRFGGLREQQQLAFEAGKPWFPGDFPGTEAGWAWEVQERERRLGDWSKRPKAKRTAWDKVESNYDGKGGKGEVGNGWACDWEFLLDERTKTVEATGGDDAGLDDTMDVDNEQVPEAMAATGPETTKSKKDKQSNSKTPPAPPPKPATLTQLTLSQARAALSNNLIPDQSTSDLKGKLATVRLTLLTRGVPQACARIYRLPSTSTNPALRKAWLALHPANIKQSKHTRKSALPAKLAKDAPAHEVQRRLAQELLNAPAQAGEDAYPACPSEEDTMGFVTAGNFNLAEGQGTGVGCLLLEKVVGVEGEGKEVRLCVVRNAGEGFARLARWDLV
ncbi:Ribonucleases P/MRP protein subunit pop1 [Extremus antarcticus]|uniref:Ribonucleases P/MRP protein subunit pop1 n=1 Tax=Extremus antarcticus TaxID=702011 RepID=A0AAJ0GFB8_9PEZI|nr:Ribonucleases P/MRP protein subunit pop1 [Extremus antarcticus]